MEYFLVIEIEDRNTMYGVLTVEFPSTTMVNSNCKRLRGNTTNKYSHLCKSYTK